MNELLLVVQCFSPACRVCWAIAPAVETLAAENPEVCFLRVDVLELPAVAANEAETQTRPDGCRRRARRRWPPRPLKGVVVAWSRPR